MKNITIKRIPFFSVVIATYNRPAKLIKALESLQMQTETDWQCIIIDDGSRNPVISDIDYIVRNDYRFKYIFKKNEGPYISKNLGAKLSNSYFVTFLDDDDLYHPQHLELRKRIIFQNPSIDMLHGGVEIIGNPYVPDCNNPNEMIHLNDCYINGTFVVKREVFNTVGGFENKFGCDFEFYQKIQAGKYVIGKTSLSTYIYNRESEDSICNKIGQDNDTK